MKKAISRDMDINGRLVVPKEMRRELMLRKLEDTINLDKDTGAVEVNMYMDGDRLIIERKNPSVCFAAHLKSQRELCTYYNPGPVFCQHGPLLFQALTSEFAYCN